jgi:hypothetical protein
MDLVQHFEDSDHKFTGHEGRWTMCGEPWGPQPTGDGVQRCPKCVDAAVSYADTMRQGQR